MFTDATYSHARCALVHVHVIVNTNHHGAPQDMLANMSEKNVNKPRSGPGSGPNVAPGRGETVAL